MQNFFTRIKAFFKNLSKTSIIIGIIIIAIVILVIYKSANKPAPITATAAVTNVVEKVTLSGTVASASAVDLGFADQGRIARVLVAQGDKVHAGDMLAQLDIADLEASLKSAQAALDIAKTNQATNTVNLQTVTDQQNTLVQNAYNALLNSNIQAQAGNQLNINDPVPTITGTYLLGKPGTITITTYESVGPTGYAFDISGLITGVGNASTTSPQPIGNSGLSIQFPAPLRAGQVWNITLPNQQAANYVTNYNAYLAAQKNHDQAIANAQASLVSTSSSSSVANAQIEQAQASIDSINASIEKRTITAPFDGVVANLTMKPGATASLGTNGTTTATATITLISQNDYQVILKVPELSVGKLSVGQHVAINLDAYGSEVFPGTIVSIDPAETIVDGVPVYQTKVNFDKNDPRIRSGMTATATVITNEHDGVIAIPASAITTKNGTSTVQILTDNKSKTIPVETGIRGSDSMIEITGGLGVGDKVVLTQ